MVRKIYLLLICFISLLFSFCKDRFEEVDQLNANFIIQKDTDYLHNDFEFMAEDSLKGIDYKWNFGDGTSLVASYNVTHSYKMPGTYSVTLTVGNISSSKEVHVYPGTLSYQIKNTTKQELILETYIDNPEVNGSVNLKLGAGSISDIIYSESIFIGGTNATALAGIWLTYNDVKYIYRPSIWLDLFKNHVIVLSDSSEFLKVSSNDVGPAKLRLGEI
ncbi:PKD domain-containing protein [Rufibacter hautae]|uniref:PKD domain-containing protein n=1 Tax=Rufibacter hautae TaxID=2595005 RepID=A0A5B6TGH6_9BACT|nr:PKD domain-containing protein [Rufibacter hautae]KAA3438300.1 PKD domain-containing protein [Rufibacter hautae]